MKKNTYLPDNNTTPKLTREEYCRCFAGVIGVHDFCTEHPIPHNINKIARTLSPSHSHFYLAKSKQRENIR